MGRVSTPLENTSVKFRSIRSAGTRDFYSIEYCECFIKYSLTGSTLTRMVSGYWVRGQESRE
jgi:hypothetical protein